MKLLASASAAALVLAAAAGLTCVPQAAAAPPAPEDRQRLEALAHAADEAWNVGDAALISSYYTEGGNVRLSSMPAPLVGREAMKAYFTKSFATRPKGLRHVTLVDHVEMISPDLAVSDAIVRIERANPDGSWSLIREYENNSLVVRSGGKWQLAAVRGFAKPAPAPVP